MPEFEIPVGNEFLNQEMDYESWLSFLDETLIKETGANLRNNYDSNNLESNEILDKTYLDEKVLSDSNLSPPPAFEDNFKKLLSDSVGTTYSAKERKKLSTQFDGYDGMKKIKEENGVSTFELITGSKARGKGAPDKIQVEMKIAKIPIMQKETNAQGKVSWPTKEREVVKLTFPKGSGFMQWDSWWDDPIFHPVVYIYGDKAYTKREDGKFRPQFKLE